MTITEPIYVRLAPEDIKEIASQVAKLLLKMSPNDLALTGDTDEFLPLSDAAEYLGVSLSTMRKMTHRRDLPYYKPGGKRVFFKRSELNEWIQKGRCKSHEEIDMEAATYVTLNEPGRKRKDKRR